MVHLAAHGETDEHFPVYSSLQFRSRRLQLYEIVRPERPVRTPVLILSACETGRSVGPSGRPPTGASLIGFPRAFLEAGAKSVVGSLWNVRDAATARLMDAFYTEELARMRTIAPGSQASSGTRPRLAEAFIRAQRSYLEKARRSSWPEHPYYWAGFFLIGDSR